MEFQWSDELLTGADDIDAQHRELFFRVNALLQACTQQKGKDEIGNYLQFMMDYAAFHFAAEEREMTTHRYPRLAEHEAEHEEFKKRINELNREFREFGASIHVVLLAVRASGDWLVKHVRGTDRKMAEFLKKKDGGVRIVL